jgi:hypothetical protein
MIVRQHFYSLSINRLNLMYNEYGRQHFYLIDNDLFTLLLTTMYPKYSNPFYIVIYSFDKRYIF